MIFQFLLCSLVTLEVLNVSAIPRNQTIDDTFGDPSTGTKPLFLPPGNWDGPSCSPEHCTVIPSPDQAYKHTYSAATYLVGQGARTAEFTFKGTDIYIFFILANTVPKAGTRTLCNFILDGQYSGSFTHLPSQSTEYEYNALVHSRHNLGDIEHKLLISADGYDDLSFINFDYAIYTYDDGAPPPQHPTSQPPTSPPLPPRPSSNPTTQSIPPNATIQLHTFVTEISGVVTTQVITSLQQQKLGSQTVSNSVSTSASSITAPTSSNSTAVIPGNTNPGNTKVTATHKTPIGAIIGGVVGAILLICILVIWFYRRARKPALALETPPPPRHPVLVPFVSLTPHNQAPEGTTANTEMSQFTPERKHREQMEFTTRRSVTDLHSMSTSPEAPYIQSMSEASDELLVHASISTSGSHRTRSDTSHSTSQREGSQVSRLVEENRLMKEQILQLQERMNSDHPFGPLIDPPPGYSNRATRLQSPFS